MNQTDGRELSTQIPLNKYKKRLVRKDCYVASCRRSRPVQMYHPCTETTMLRIRTGEADSYIGDLTRLWWEIRRERGGSDVLKLLRIVWCIRKTGKTETKSVLYLAWSRNSTSYWMSPSQPMDHLLNRRVRCELADSGGITPERTSFITRTFTHREEG